MPVKFNVGQDILISYNPFHNADHDILGHVYAVDRGASLGGADLIHVDYRSPYSGESHALPFAAYNLEPATPEALRTKAVYHQSEADRMNALAMDLEGAANG